MIPLAGMALIAWALWLFAKNFTFSDSCFMCHGTEESQHFYQGIPPCPQCEADRARKEQAR